MAFPLVSTTSLMRQAGALAGWEVAGAVGVLRGWQHDYPNAKSAVRVILKRTKGAARYGIAPSGMVVAAD